MLGVIPSIAPSVPHISWIATGSRWIWNWQMIHTFFTYREILNTHVCQYSCRRRWILVTVSHDSKRALQLTIPQYVFDFITCLQRQEKFAKLIYCLQQDRIGRASMLYCFSYAQPILTTMTTNHTQQCPLRKERFGFDSLFATEKLCTKFIVSAIQ